MKGSWIKIYLQNHQSLNDKDSNMKLTDKVIIISGAASGLGLETVEKCLSLGANVVGLDSNSEQLSLLEARNNFKGYLLDVTQADAIEQLAESVGEEYGSIDAVINCAGVAPAQRMVGRQGPMNLNDFERVISINLVGTFNVMRAFSAQMMQQDGDHSEGQRGVIINTASVAAFEGQVGQAAYSASKGGVVAMTLPLARELAPWGIRVMTIAPGVMQTPMVEMMPDKVQESFMAQAVYPKRLGKSSEFAQLVVHIINNTFLNGEVIRLDGAVRLSA